MVVSSSTTKGKSGADERDFHILYTTTSIQISDQNTRRTKKPRDSLKKDHSSGAQRDTHQRHHLSSLARSPQCRIQHDISREHLHARGVDQHARTDSAQHALRDFRSRDRTGVRVTSAKHVETGEDARGRRECKEEGENGAEPAEDGLLRIIGRRWKGGDAYAEREAFEDLMEQYRRHERFEISARGKRESEPDDERVNHDT
jgi:hypothetical protein